MNGSYNAKPRYAVTHHGNIEDERAPLALSLTLLPPVPSIHPVGPRVERARGHRAHCPLTGREEAKKRGREEAKKRRRGGGWGREEEEQEEGLTSRRSRRARP